MASRSPEVRAAIAARVSSFCRTVSALARELLRQYPTDAQIYRIERRIQAAITVDPVDVVETAGKYLYAYRAQLYSDDPAAIEAFFGANNFDAELRAEEDREIANLAAYVIVRAKQAAAGLSAAERQAYISTVVSLLDDYIEYRCAINPDIGV